MKLLEASDYRVMPWKNGGGTTTEIFVVSSTPDRFDWRVSIATVASDGPFSRFEGYDRHILCIEGQGFDLRGGPGGDIAVLPDLQPRRFSGDWEVFGCLRSGRCRDFNLIARRDLYRSSLTFHRLSGALRLADPDAWRLVYILNGSAETDGVKLATGAAVLLEPGDAVVLTGYARAIVARVMPVQVAGAR
jgi:environmental stress-induced protein Ves